METSFPRQTPLARERRRHTELESIRILELEHSRTPWAVRRFAQERAAGARNPHRSSIDIRGTDVLRTTLDENLAMVADSVAFLKAHGKEVVVDAEHFFDGLRASRDYAIAVLDAAAGAGADWVVLCDTNGGSQPDELAAAVADVVARDLAKVGVHLHNDGELAVANTLAAVAAGASQVQGTINGYGERTGNCNLTTIIPNLSLKMGIETIPADRMDRLTPVAHHIAELVNRPGPYREAALRQSEDGHG